MGQPLATDASERNGKIFNISSITLNKKYTEVQVLQPKRTLFWQ